MQKQSNVHFLSICLTLTILVGVWLLLEYDGRLQPKEPAVSSTPNVQPTTPRQATPTPSSPLIDRNTNANPVTFTFKCERNGRVSFGDQPCGSSEKTLDVSTTTREPPRNHQRELAKLKEEVAKMEAERLTRERTATLALNKARATATKNQCVEIDETVKSIDEQARAPHSPPEGDRLNAERRKPMDQRFFLGC